MAIFLVLGVSGLLLLVVALLFDGFLEAVTDSIGLDGNGVISLPVIAAFISTVGFTGMLVMGASDASASVATLAGVGAGLVVGGLAARVTKMMMNSPTDATPSSGQLPGLTGTVVTPIPPGGLGEVILRVSGQPVKFNARSDEPLAAGTSVVVVSTLSSSSVQVRPQPA